MHATLTSGACSNSALPMIPSQNAFSVSPPCIMNQQRFAAHHLQRLSNHGTAQHLARSSLLPLTVCSAAASSRGTPNGGASTSNPSDELESMKRQIESLRESVETQQMLIKQQQDMLELLSGGHSSFKKSAGSPLLEQLRKEDDAAMRELSNAAITDRRSLGVFDARYHSTAMGATPPDYRTLPRHIVLVRHAESEGNVDTTAYTYLPDPKVPLTQQGWLQAMEAGEKIRAKLEKDSQGDPYRLFFYMSPYVRSRQTYEGVVQAFSKEQVAGAQEEVQLREQDFGNFQDTEGMKREKAERLRFGRFFYRFPNGESGADVYDRMTMFEDHLVRDINAGRFANNSSLVLVTHGLALRIFLMRWFHWTVDQFMRVYNPPNADPIILERVTNDVEARQGGPATWIHTKALYRLSEESRKVLTGCSEDMARTGWMPRGLTTPPPEVHKLLELMDGDRKVDVPPLRGLDDVIMDEGNDQEGVHVEDPMRDSIG